MCVCVCVCVAKGAHKSFSVCTISMSTCVCFSFRFSALPFRSQVQLVVPLLFSRLTRTQTLPVHLHSHLHTLAHELGHAHTHVYVCTCMQSLLLDCTSGLFSYTAIDCSTMQLHTGMHTHILRPIHIHIQEQYRVRRHIRPLCQAMDFYSDSGRMLK